MRNFISNNWILVIRHRLQNFYDEYSSTWLIRYQWFNAMIFLFHFFKIILFFLVLFFILFIFFFSISNIRLILLQLKADDADSFIQYCFFPFSCILFSFFFWILTTLCTQSKPGISSCYVTVFFLTFTKGYHYSYSTENRITCNHNKCVNFDLSIEVEKFSLLFFLCLLTKMCFTIFKGNYRAKYAQALTIKDVCDRYRTKAGRG